MGWLADGPSHAKASKLSSYPEHQPINPSINQALLIAFVSIGDTDNKAGFADNFSCEVSSRRLLSASFLESQHKNVNATATAMTACLSVKSIINHALAAIAQLT